MRRIGVLAMKRPDVQAITDNLPVLPPGVWITDLHDQLYGPQEDRTGFLHSSGEWNLLYKHENKMYRLPVLLNQKNFT